MSVFTSVYAELLKQVRDAGLLHRRRDYYGTAVLGALGAFVAVWVGVVLLATGGGSSGSPPCSAS